GSSPFTSFVRARGSSWQDSRPSQTHRLRRWSHLLTPDSLASNDSPTALRRTASCHHSRPRAYSALRRARRAVLPVRAAPATPHLPDQVAPPCRSQLALFFWSVSSELNFLGLK